ncbi:DNA-binding NarL/FixJ family response regulator [Desulfitispora alkaliphila]|uniref:response regulator n=1 Tax=Desulfitispora alkaliphila TaxID=622674 RepID=UPI003D1C5FDA
MEPVKILLVDDHVLVRKGIISLMATEEQFEIVGEASNGIEALELAKEVMPDIILMDINMPQCNGIEATKLIKKQLPYVKIVMLTVCEDDQHLFEAVKSGASGYLLKNLEPDNLVSSLLEVVKGEAPISPSMATKIMNEFAQVTNPKPEPNAINDLTKREKEVLEMLIDGLTNKEIAKELSISENTVRNHIRNIFDKLHIENRVQAATYALQQGISGKKKIQ